MVCVSLMKRRRGGRETNREYPIKSACTHSSPLAGLSEEAFQLGGVVLISLLSSYLGCCCRFSRRIRGSLGLTDSSLNTDDLSCLGRDTKMKRTNNSRSVPLHQGSLPRAPNPSSLAIPEAIFVSGGKVEKGVDERTLGIGRGYVTEENE